MQNGSAVDEALRELVASVERDDWDACDAWGLGRIEDPRLGHAASVVCEALERDRARRQTSREEGTGDGLLETHRRLFRGIARLWGIGARGGAVRELGAERDFAYGVLVEGERRIALVAASSRDTVVAADASEVRGARRERQLLAVLGALAYGTYDKAGVGRRFDLEVGTVNHVDLLSGTCPLWPSRWRVERGAALAPWLDGEAVVAVRPEGGRLALASFVVQLEQAVKRLQQKVWLDRQRGVALEKPSFSTEDVERVLDKLELLEGWGWTPDIEPLRPHTARLVALVRVDADPTVLQAAVIETVGDEAP